METLAQYREWMSARGRFGRLWERVLSLGSYQEEPETQQGKRRIIVGVSVVFVMFNLMAGFGELGAGRGWLAVTAWLTVAANVTAMTFLRFKPRWFAGVLNALFAFLSVVALVETVLLGGLLQSSAQMLWGLLTVLGALIALNLRSAFAWLVVFTVSVIAAAWLPTWIGAIYTVEASAAELAINISGVTVLVFATMAYFVRQRDRFQQQSDDLLHNILPHEIAKRLKAENKMIADHFESASVLFADVVDFTPMSAGMSPAELIGLLNEVFSAFDRFVDELGLEKIKTVGDEYMVASGVPVERPDHAESLAELALRIRDFVASNTFNGHKIELRIGIHSGPVVAGVIGIHKYAYDLWGDSVNTASRMESEGLPGSIQVSATTYELIGDSFVCEPRGVVSVKGKGDLITYFLVGRHADAAIAR